MSKESLLDVVWQQVQQIKPENRNNTRLFYGGKVKQVREYHKSVFHACSLTEKEMVGFVFEIQNEDSFVGVLEGKSRNIYNFLHKAYLHPPEQFVIFLCSDEIGGLGFPAESWTCKILVDNNEEEETKRSNDDSEATHSFWIRAIQDCLSKIQLLGKKLLGSGPSQTELFLNTCSADWLPKCETVRNLVTCPFAFTLAEFVELYILEQEIWDDANTHPPQAEEALLKLT